MFPLWLELFIENTQGGFIVTLSQGIAQLIVFEGDARFNGALGTFLDKLALCHFDSFVI